MAAWKVLCVQEEPATCAVAKQMFYFEKNDMMGKLFRRMQARIWLDLKADRKEKALQLISVRHVKIKEDNSV